MGKQHCHLYAVHDFINFFFVVLLNLNFFSLSRDAKVFKSGILMVIWNDAM